VLNVPLTNAIKGIYTIEAWVKYTHDYNGADKYAINTEWWGVAAVGVIGTTKLGWPQSPDRWEKVSVTFDTGQHAPLNMKWFVGKRDNGGNIGYIYVTDLSIDGPQGTYLFGNFANGADLSYYDASSSSATSTYSILSYLNSNQLTVNLVNKNDRPELYDTINKVILTENTDTTMFQIVYNDADSTMVLSDNDVICNNRNGITALDGWTSMETCQSICAQNTSCAAVSWGSKEYNSGWYYRGIEGESCNTVCEAVGLPGKCDAIKMTEMAISSCDEACIASTIGGSVPCADTDYGSDKDIGLYPFVLLPSQSCKTHHTSESAASTCDAADNEVARICACTHRSITTQRCTLFNECKETKKSYGSNVYAKTSTLHQMYIMNDQSTPETWSEHWQLVSSSNEALCGSWCIKLRDFISLDYETIPGYSIALRLVDGEGSETFGTFDINVQDVNEKPVITDTAVRQIFENPLSGDEVPFEVEKIDEDGDGMECKVIDGNLINSLPALKWYTDDTALENWTT
jgi:hypothetical protein